MTVDAPNPTTARALWCRYELIHDLVYFSPHVLSRATDIGLRGFWMTYFALRAAPMGPVDPAVVTATFFGFAHDRVARALPSAWLHVTPEQALATRSVGVQAALREFAQDDRALAEAADILWDAAECADTAGRPLAAANQAIPRPSAPEARLWQATTTLREHRGDGHVATLVARGITPAEAHLIKVAAGESDADMLRAGRGVSDDAWHDAAQSLQDRGWTNADRTLTVAGRQVHDDLETTTDERAARPWNVIGTDATQRAVTLLDPLARAIAASGLIPSPHPAGLAWEPS